MFLHNLYQKLKMQIPVRFSKQLDTAQICGTHRALESTSIGTALEEAVQKKEVSFRYKQAFKPLLEGSLKKKTLNLVWHSRYFVLTPTRLMYYSDSTRKQLKGCFNIAALIRHRLEIVVAIEQITLSIQLSEDQQRQTLLQLQAEDIQHVKKWSSAIKICAHSLQSLPLGKFPVKIPAKCTQNSNGNFWKKLTISQTELSLYAGHLDIILFRSKDKMVTLGRVLMQSTHDHVGILLKDETEETYVYEATQAKGVCVTPLREILEDAFLLYNQISYRKLICSHALAVNPQSLEKYLNLLVGSFYQLSLSKLLIGSQSEEENKENEPISQDLTVKKKEMTKTYFCSELVADIYIRFGLLKKGKSSSYWPKDFEGNIILNSGYSLSSLMSIELNG